MCVEVINEETESDMSHANGTDNCSIATEDEYNCEPCIHGLYASYAGSLDSMIQCVSHAAVEPQVVTWHLCNRTCFKRAKDTLC